MQYKSMQFLAAHLYSPLLASLNSIREHYLSYSIQNQCYKQSDTDFRFILKCPSELYALFCSFSDHDKVDAFSICCNIHFNLF